MRAGLVHGVPAHVRNFEFRTVFIDRIFNSKTHHFTREPTQAVRVAFFGMTEQHLLTDTHAEHRFGFRRFGQCFEQPTLAQMRHAVGHRTLTWQDDALGLTHHIGVARNLYIGIRCGGFHRLRHTAQIAHAIV